MLNTSFTNEETELCSKYIYITAYRHEVVLNRWERYVSGTQTSSPGERNYEDPLGSAL